jgi:hypothetical protein
MAVGGAGNWPRLLRRSCEPGPLAVWLPSPLIGVTMTLDAEAARQLHNRLHEVLGEPEARSLMELLENLASRSDVDALRTDVGRLGADLRTDMETLGTQLRGEMETLGTQLRGEMGNLGTQLRTEMEAMRHELTGAFHKDLLAAVTGQTRTIIYANLGLVFASVGLALAAAQFAG